MQLALVSVEVARLAMLSVSSVGSEAMQHLILALGIIPFWLLSVSSVGSEAMQPDTGIGIVGWHRAFSILGRIGGDATGCRV